MIKRQDLYPILSQFFDFLLIVVSSSPQSDMFTRSCLPQSFGEKKNCNPFFFSFHQCQMPGVLDTKLTKICSLKPSQLGVFITMHRPSVIRNDVHISKIKMEVSKNHEEERELCSEECWNEGLPWWPRAKTCTPSSGGLDSIPGRGTRSYML